MTKVYKITAKLQIFDMYAPWMYLPIPNEKVPNVRPGGWGSIPVIATIGKTTWKTSLFPAKEIGYFLPVKKAVAKKESLTVGKLVEATFSRPNFKLTAAYGNIRQYSATFGNISV